MSVAQATAFIEYVGASPALQREIDGYSGPGVLKRLVDLGARTGFSFTEEDYRNAVIELADGELSDESLDAVLRETGLKQ
jgi:predicted ribosomally synthesized peptide with nif11-like leader